MTSAAQGRKISPRSGSSKASLVELPSIQTSGVKFMHILKEEDFIWFATVRVLRFPAGWWIWVKDKKGFLWLRQLSPTPSTPSTPCCPLLLIGSVGPSVSRIKKSLLNYERLWAHTCDCGWDILFGNGRWPRQRPPLHPFHCFLPLSLNRTCGQETAVPNIRLALLRCILGTQSLQQIHNYIYVWIIFL